MDDLEEGQVDAEHAEEAREGSEKDAVDEAVKRAIEEIEEEEAVNRGDAEGPEHEDVDETEPTPYEELEERVKEVLEDYGHSQEEVDERWEETREQDMEESLREQQEGGVEKDPESEESSEGHAAEGEQYHEAGDGTVYVTKQGESEQTTHMSSETEAETAEAPEAPQPESEEQAESTIDEATSSKAEQPTHQEDVEANESSDATVEAAESPPARAPEAPVSEERGAPASEVQVEEVFQEESASQVNSEASETEPQEEVEEAESEEESAAEQAEEATREETHVEEANDDESTVGAKEGKATDEAHAEEDGEDEAVQLEEAVESPAPSDSREDGEVQEEAEVVQEHEEQWWGHMVPEEVSFSMFPEVQEANGTAEVSEEERERAEAFLSDLEEMTEVEIQMVEELDKFVAENPDVKEDEYFEEDYERAVRYLEFMEKLRTTYTDEELAEKDHYEVATELGVKPAEVTSWVTKKQRPQLIRSVEKRVQTKKAKSLLDGVKERRLNELAQKKPEEWLKAEYDWLLEMYLKLQRHPKFQERYRLLHVWLDIMQKLRDGEASGNPDREELKRWAHQLGVSIATVKSWLTRKQVPFLALLLQRRVESATKKYDWDQLIQDPTGYVRRGQTRVQRCEPANKADDMQVTAFFHQYNDGSAKGLAQAISSIMDLEKAPVLCMDIPSEFVHAIENKLNDVEEEINVLLGYSSDGMTRVRLALLKDRLYIRRQDTHPWHLRNLLGGELFYFKGEHRLRLLDETFMRLGIVSRKKFAVLVRRLTDFGPLDEMPAGGTNKDLQTKAKYLQGETINLILDVLGMRLKDMEEIVEQLGQSIRGSWQIRNPKFMEGEEFLIWASRLFAIIVSDGNIDHSSFGLTYWEKNEERSRRVRDLIRLIGDASYIEVIGESGAPGYQYSPLLGRLLFHLGIPKGDKVLQGVHLPAFIKYGSDAVKQAYLQELVPEEGSITFTREGNAKISWGRTVVLYDVNKEHLYGRVERITPEHIEFLKRKDVSSYEKRRKCFRAPTGTIRKLRDSLDSETARLASEIYKIVMRYPPSLMVDEQGLCTSLGITSSRHLSYIRYYERSGRVSAHWEATVSSLKDVARWSLLAPPNDLKKASRLADWVAKKLERVLEELANFEPPSEEKKHTGLAGGKKDGGPE